MANPPIPQWFKGSNNTSDQVNSVVNYGIVDADTVSPSITYYFWNNRGGAEDVADMEDVQITARDRNGGLGDTPGNVVEAVRDNWFEVRVDSLNETSFTPIGKGGVGTVNPSGTRLLGAEGSTTNVNFDTATVWNANQALSLDAYVKPVVDNGFIYLVVTAGTTGATEPTWIATEGLLTDDGTVQYRAVPIVKTPVANEILGLANNTSADGSNANLAEGNFSQFTTQVNVPINASSGKNEAALRISYKFV